MMKLRNPWGKTEYKGKGCETDNEFWDGVKQNVKERMRPANKKGEREGRSEPLMLDDNDYYDVKKCMSKVGI